MTKPRDSQVSAEQGADEERKEDVQSGTLTASQRPQRSNADASPDSVDSSAVQQGRTVRKSGKKAVIATGGNQYLVSEGQSLEVELLKDQKSTTFEPLLVIDGDKVSVGKPTVEGVKVTADIVEQVVKADKVIAIRYEAKKRVNKRQGHRQRHTLIKITKIS